MCLYWKKLHTCSHLSDRFYIEMCRPGCLSNTVCSDIAEDSKPRPSHFPCWSCIKAEARADKEAALLAEEKARAKAQEDRDRALKEKQAAESKAKEEKIRREARERAAREREEELRIKREKEEEDKRAKKEGGPWIETGSLRRGKGKRSVPTTPITPIASITPISSSCVTATATSRDRKENENGKISPKKESGGGYLSPKRDSPKKEKRSSQGGRAGTWGPPKKILSRVDNENGVGSG